MISTLRWVIVLIIITFGCLSVSANVSEISLRVAAPVIPATVVNLANFGGVGDGATKGDFQLK